MLYVPHAAIEQEDPISINLKLPLKPLSATKPATKVIEVSGM
jgi:hypothetical protein